MTATFLEAQLGFGVESTFGTRVVPTVFSPFLNETIDNVIDYMQSNSYRAGRKYPVLRRPGGTRVHGDINMELAPQGLQILLRQCLGTLVTTGAGPYLHTLTPGALVGQSLSAQIVRTDQNGTVRPFDYSGMKVTAWEIAAQVGQIATLKTSWYGVKEDTSQSVATATYPSNLLPFTFIEGSLTIGGTATPVKSLTYADDLGLMVDRYRISATTPSQSLEPVEAAIHKISGTLVADFTNLTAYQRFTNQTQATLAITFAQAGGHQLVITSTVEFDGQTPQASGIGNEIPQNLPFVGVNATSDANVVTLALTNSDATP